MSPMRKMSNKEYERKLARVKQENEYYKRKNALKQARVRRFEFKLPTTSKLVLLCVILMCLEIIIFAEYAMLKTGNISAMYSLIGVPATLTPTIWAYYAKSKAENTKGGIVYDTAMANAGVDVSIKDIDNAVG